MEKLFDFMVYFVRNFFDYGLEIVDKCVVVGKDFVGIVIFNVFY